MPNATAIQKRTAIPTSVSVILHSEFFLTGTVTALLGAILPVLRSRYGVSDQQAGSLFVVQFLGSSIAALLSQIRCGLSVTVGSALIAAGVLGLAFSSWPVAHLSIFCFGLGLGFVIPATNMIVARSAGGHRAASLSILNLFWGAGAATCPLLAALLLHRVALRGMLILLAIAAGSLCFLLLGAGITNISAAVDSTSSPTDIRGTRPAHPRMMAFFSLMLFLYIGVESSIGGWTAAYAKEMGLSDPIPTAALFCFWLALLGGRALTPIALRFMAESRLFLAALVLAGCGIASLILSHSGAALTVSAFVTAAGLAPLFASILSLLSHRAEDHRVRIPGWAFSLAGVGGAAMPWLVGSVATIAGSLRYGFLVTALAVFLILIMARSFEAFPITDRHV